MVLVDAETMTSQYYRERAHHSLQNKMNYRVKHSPLKEQQLDEAQPEYSFYQNIITTVEAFVLAANRKRTTPSRSASRISSVMMFSVHDHEYRER